MFQELIVVPTEANEVSDVEDLHVQRTLSDKRIFFGYGDQAPHRVEISDFALRGCARTDNRRYSDPEQGSS